MHFNPGKCEVIRITDMCRIIDAKYTFHNVQLNQTKKEKYLGLIFIKTLSWHAHIYTITKKAKYTTAFLRRNLSTYQKAVKDTCYKAFLRPQVVYGATGWDPHTTVNINKVEAVKRRATWFVAGDYRYTSSVTAMINCLGWESLQHRRQQAKEVIKIPHCTLHGSDFNQFTPPKPWITITDP